MNPLYLYSYPILTITYSNYLSQINQQGPGEFARNQHIDWVSLCPTWVYHQNGNTLIQIAAQLPIWLHGNQLAGVAAMPQHVAPMLQPIAPLAGVAGMPQLIVPPAAQVGMANPVPNQPAQTNPGVFMARPVRRPTSRSGKSTIPRPQNAWILYRNAHHQATKAVNSGLHNNALCKFTQSTSEIYSLTDFSGYYFEIVAQRVGEGEGKVQADGS